MQEDLHKELRFAVIGTVVLDLIVLDYLAVCDEIQYCSDYSVCFWGVSA